MLNWAIGEQQLQYVMENFNQIFHASNCQGTQLNTPIQPNTHEEILAPPRQEKIKHSQKKKPPSHGKAEW